MIKTMLVAGKDLPAGNKFADAVTFTGRNVVVTGSASEIDVPSTEEETDEETAQKIESAKVFSPVKWNRSSSLSARTLVLQTENDFDSMDEAVLFFDEEYYASLAAKMDAGECSRTCDELIAGFQYLTLEVFARFEKKRAGGSNPGKIVFLLQEGPCMMDALRSPILRNGSTAIASPLVAAAAGAFVAFAENIAAVYGDMDYVNIVLVRGDHGIDAAKTDDVLAKWLGTYLDAVDELKNKLAAKKSIQWVKPGAKNPNGFSLFK